MSTQYDLTKSSDSAYPVAYKSAGATLVSHVVDIAKDIPTVTAGDSAKMITIPAGFFVKDVFVRTITASATGSSTLEIGDSAGATGYNASIDATAAAGTVANANGSNIFTQLGSGTYAVTWKGGKYYSAADYILLTLGSTAPAAGVFEVAAWIVPLGTLAAI